MCSVMRKDWGNFNVQALQSVAKSSFAQTHMEHLEGCKNDVGLSIFEVSHQNGIAIVIVQDHDVIVAHDGWC